MLIAAILVSCLGVAQAQTSTRASSPDIRVVQSKDQDKQKDASKDQAKDQSKDQQQPAAAEKPKTIDEVTKDFTKMDGLLPIYRQTKDGKDTVYVEVPEDHLDKLMLIQITAASGMGDTSAFVYHGMPIGDVPAKFHKVSDKRIDLISPNLAHRGYTPESALGISRTFPDTVLGNFDVVATQPERKSMLVDVSNFFRSDIDDLSAAVDVPGAGGFGIDPGNSRIDTVKNFPDNFVIHTIYQLQRKGPPTGDPRSVPWAVSFNVSDLPTDDGYQPRLGDPRVGYFTTDFQDLTDATQEFDSNVSYILRWNLKKKDPTAAVSDPVKPIVFYIDNAVPPEYRDDVRKGILLWNTAFEKEGISNAIEVRQMPDDADWDIADLRYNTVRWTTGMPFAIALFRANPMTGEILNASINMDAGFAAAGSSQFDNVIDPASSHLKFLQPKDESFIAPSILKKYGPLLCDMEERGRTVQAVGMAAEEALTPNMTLADKKRMIDEYIVETVCHEMGHCLGLRHNFAASTQLTMKDLSDPTMVNKYGVGASVMDYNPFNAGAIGRTDVPFYSPTVGTYDFWAIDYGYRQINATSPSDEVSTLKTIASLGSTPGHLWESDGSADDFDPYVVRFDSSRQPLDYLETMTNYGPEIRTRAHMKIANGESYYKFTRTWMAGMSAQINNALAASEFIGGGRLFNSFHGDPNEQPAYSPIPGSVQRRALVLMTKALFSEDSFKIDRHDLSLLTFNPKSPGYEVSGRARIFPIEQSIANAERFGLMAILDGDTLMRMKNNEYRVGPAGNTLTVAEMFHTLDRNVWSEVDAGKPVADLRRELQRSYLDLMIPMALGQARGVPADARDLAMDELVSLKHRITLALPNEKDAYTAPHLRECLVRINHALSAQSVVPVGQ